MATKSALTKNFLVTSWKFLKKSADTKPKEKNMKVFCQGRVRGEGRLGVDNHVIGGSGIK